MTKKFHLLSLVIGSFLLLILIWKIGLYSLWREMGTLGWGLVPLILIEGVADLFHTQGWRHCLSGPHRSLSFFHLFKIRMAGASINYVTPTAGLAGEVTKGTLLSLHHQGPEAAAAVITGKLAYVLAQLLFVSLGSFIILGMVHLPAGVWIAMLAATALLAGGLLGFLAVQKYGKLGALFRWLDSHRIGGRLLKRLAGPVTLVDQALMDFYREHPFDLPAAILWHMVGSGCGIVQSWMFFSLMTGDGSWVAAAAVWFLGSWLDLLSFAIPLNLGVLEATRVIAFEALSFRPSLGLAYGMTLRFEQIFWAGVGLLIYVSFVVKNRREKTGRVSI